MASFKFGWDFVKIYRDEVLGVGSFGKVCKAKCGQLPCAAKLLHDIFLQVNDPGIHHTVAQFMRECQLVSTIRHPNIVQHLGTTQDPKLRTPILLMELMDENLTRFLEESIGPLHYHSQLNICHDVALALDYLHFNAIIHRDLSSNHVLLSGEGSKAKLGGFVMAKRMDESTRTHPMTPVPGTPAYMPPEANFDDANYSNKLDCFSHGVLTLQIITRNFPLPGAASRYVEDPSYPNGRVVEQFPEVERRRKDIDLVESSHPLLPIVLQCLKDRDTERPSADELCEKLAALKGEPRYTHSVEQSKNTRRKVAESESELQRENEWLRGIQEMNKELQEKEHDVQQAREEIQRLQEEINAKNAELERAKKFEQQQEKNLDKKHQALAVYKHSVEQARERIQRLQEEIEVKNTALDKSSKEQIKRKNIFKTLFYNIALI